MKMLMTQAKQVRPKLKEGVMVLSTDLSTEAELHVQRKVHWTKGVLRGCQKEALVTGGVWGQRPNTRARNISQSADDTQRAE